MRIAAEDGRVTMLLSAPCHGSASGGSIRFSWSPEVSSKVRAKGLKTLSRFMRRGNVDLVTIAVEASEKVDGSFPWTLVHGDASYGFLAVPWISDHFLPTEQGALLLTMPARSLAAFLSRAVSMMPRGGRGKGACLQGLCYHDGLFFLPGKGVGATFCPQDIEIVTPHSFQIEKPVVTALLDLLGRSPESRVQVWSMPDSSIRLVVGSNWVNGRTASQGCRVASGRRGAHAQLVGRRLDRPLLEGPAV